MPDEVKLAEIISEIHRTSFSPTGQFGFHVTIYDGKLPLLYPSLYEDHRTVTPYLIHGNLWGQNIDTDPRTENIYIFDACGYYAHHKMAIGMWRLFKLDRKAVNNRRTTILQEKKEENRQLQGSNLRPRKD
ncbi:hypothetical protein N7455_002986 [Penicillium solitum]|uniref:uncharacterized protein n=1 Tax=Penicillium solitum TaxID=60172 RepID=UPI0032C49730|nr:hypothetical protein N7455_002986 [Penicillium solitum]